MIEQLVNEAIGLDKKIKERGVLRAKHEGLDLDERLSDPKNEYFNNLEKFAMDHLNYYQCWQCKDPFFGGLRQCGNNANIQALQQNGVVVNQNPYDLICPKCRYNS